MTDLYSIIERKELMRIQNERDHKQDEIRIFLLEITYEHAVGSNYKSFHRNISVISKKRTRSSKDKM